MFLWISIMGFLTRLEDSENVAMLQTITLQEDSTLQRSIMIYFHNRNNRGLYPNIRRGKKHILMYLSLTLILNASDIELNPGPRTPKYPCQICSKAVTWNQRGVACDDCDKWFHAECMHMSTPVYMSLQNISWHCTNCGMPQFSSSLFESTILSSNNSFLTLDNSNTSEGTVLSPGPPKSCSSPIVSARPTSKSATSLKVIVINFQSIKNKKEEVANLIEQSDPSIIMGTETWLTPSISSAEFFPSNYEVLRKDRKDGHGGVLLAIKKDLIIDTVDINTLTEAVFAKLQMGKNVSLFIGALYRSPSSDIEYMNQL